MKRLFSLVFATLLCGVMYAQVTLSPLFADNMVLQQQTRVALWGKAAAGKAVKVTTSWNKRTYGATAGTDGKWSVTVDTPAAGGPYDIRIAAGGSTVTLRNVLIGEVWLCSGQSNMEMTIAGWGKINNYEQEVAAANFPQIRLMNVGTNASSVAEDSFANMEGFHGWEVCSPATIERFSATAYFFGRTLWQQLHVPIGLILSSWGGTNIESWISPDALSQVPEFYKAATTLKEMPSKEQMHQEFLEEKAKWEHDIPGIDRGFSNGKAVWAATDFDDAAWSEVAVPGIMNSRELGEFDGIMWMRREIDIPASWTGSDLSLSLGCIDDNDITFINGVEVGRTWGCRIDRHYTVPASLVKPGKNLIAIMVTDTHGDVGFTSTTEKVWIGRGADRLSLAGQWKYKISSTAKDLPPFPMDRSATAIRNIPCALYNGMINPLVPYTIKGAIWYQGENNAPRAYQYRYLQPLLIRNWRDKWGYNFPFYYVQLANYMARTPEPAESPWAELREAQALSLGVENTGMAVIIDIGDEKDIHPKNKQEVGRRLALIALNKDYGKDVVYSGPLYSHYRIEGNKIRLFFDHVHGGLRIKDADRLKGFSIAGADKEFHWAQAEIQDNTVVVWSDSIAYPIAVRYAWANNPECNLYNAEGLPASPFRTDDFDGNTRHAR